MSLMDIMQCIGDGKDRDLTGMKGSFSVAIGDVVAGIFGARHTHIFGSEIKLVCDPLDFAFGRLEEKVPAVAALLNGIGGQATFVYAQNTSATYGGPKVDIRRATNYNKQTDYIIPREGAPPHVSDPPDPIDVELCIAVTVLSVLVNLVPAVLELVVRFKYPSYGATNPSEQTQNTINGYGETPKILNDCAYTITSRLMGFLKEIEGRGNFVQVALSCLDSMKKFVKWIGDLIKGAATRVSKAAEDVAAAASRQFKKIKEQLRQADMSFGVAPYAAVRI